MQYFDKFFYTFILLFTIIETLLCTHRIAVVSVCGIVLLLSSLVALVSHSFEVQQAKSLISKSFGRYVDWDDVPKELTINSTDSITSTNHSIACRFVFVWHAIHSNNLSLYSFNSTRVGDYIFTFYNISTTWIIFLS